MDSSKGLTQAVVFFFFSVAVSSSSNSAEMPNFEVQEPNDSPTPPEDRVPEGLHRNYSRFYFINSSSTKLQG